MTSVQICMDSNDWQQQNGMQERGLKSPDDMMSACSRPLLERRPVKQPADQQALKCPRCDSPNTKFCYYNNYSLSQPRHFCKTCRRYWTRGGALRNVPVGGGCRKNKRTKRGGLDIPGGGLTSSNSANPSSAHDLVTNPFHHTPNGSMYYGLPSSGNEISLAFARIQQAARLGDRSAMANCKNSSDFNLGRSIQSSIPSSHLSALSALKSSQLSALEFPITSGRQDQASEDFCSFLETNPHMPGPININPPLTATTSNLTMFTAPDQNHHGQNNIDSGIHWNRLNDQSRIPLPLMHEGHHPDDTQALTHNFSGEHHHHTISKSKVKTEEPENRLVSEWQIIPGAAASETLFQTTGDNPDYWNGGAWPDLMTSYVGSSSIGPIV